MTVQCLQPKRSIFSTISCALTVVLVRVDPKTDDEIALLLHNGAMVIADLHGPNISDKRIELH